MSKVITSPVERFPGTVTLSDPLTFPQVFAVQDALDTAQELDKNITSNKARHALLPGLLECVEEWSIDNFPDSLTIDNFPATPVMPVAELIAWLSGEVVSLFYEAEPDPNE